MTTRTYRIYGREGHRQALSFGESVKYDWSENGNTRIIELDKADKTGTNDYVILKITCNNLEECEYELDRQISDGLFENCFVGIIEEM